MTTTEQKNERFSVATKAGHVRPHPARPIYKRIDAAYYITRRITFYTINKYCVVIIVVRCCRYPIKTCHHSALIVELLDLPTTRSYVIVVVNSQAVNNVDVTYPSIVSVRNRRGFVRYCSNSTSYLFSIVFIHYDSYYHMLYESAY